MSFGRLIMVMAPNGHFFVQIPHPMHRISEIFEIFDVGVTSTQSLPMRTTGQNFMHLIVAHAHKHYTHTHTHTHYTHTHTQT